MSTVVAGPQVLRAAEWSAREAAHRSRARDLTAAHRERQSRGQRHPVEDFLFDYYTLRAGRLERWHPGTGVRLSPDGATPEDLARLDARAAWRWYRTTDDGAVEVDAARFVADRGPALSRLLTVLRATASRPAHLGCLGLHEWAMVYRQPPAERRHDLPLRLGAEGTDAVVESHPVRCTHFDAFRFFTPAARPFNRLQPTRESQAELEQPGCLHANMDLLHAALTLSPACPGDLLLDAFELARDIRVLDMRASPYDVTPLGLTPVAIETADGRAEYVAAQRGFAERARPLRERLVDVGEGLGL
ncbi:3-methyladenine DNA glycosylase [Georgenia wutianyii]|uniref:3-methyladenine DNA glycosylase n=1 Tax=Georgenia wutianyii TaxID=2585135 RepID=A0ABX5VLC7_9MICO|nr:3-methyladenine DNA glycosylase [Georgenia wutianyii]QDB78113.1 3-methyladenine DNA glycosylase [Georgenia wutianyii]